MQHRHLVLIVVLATGAGLTAGEAWKPPPPDPQDLATLQEELTREPTDPGTLQALLAAQDASAEGAAGECLREALAAMCRDAPPGGRTALLLAEGAADLWEAAREEHDDLRLACEARLRELVTAWLPSATLGTGEGEVGELSRRLQALHLARACGVPVPRLALDGARVQLASHLEHPGVLACVLYCGDRSAGTNNAIAALQGAHPDGQHLARLLAGTDTLEEVLPVALALQRSVPPRRWRAWQRAYHAALPQALEEAGRTGVESAARRVLLHACVGPTEARALSRRAPGAPAPDPGWILTTTTFGPLVMALDEGGAAAAAGLHRGDLVARVRDRRIRDTGELRAALRGLTELDPVQVVYERDGREEEVTLVLGREPRRHRPSLGKLQSPEDPVEGQRWEGWSDEDFERLPVPRQEHPLPRKQLEQLSLRAFSSLPWLRELPEALDRAQAEGRPVFWYLDLGWRPEGGDPLATPTYRAQDYDWYIRTTLFHYASTRELLRRRFVLLHAKVTRELAERYGILRFSFVEPGWIVLDPEGGKLWQMDGVATFSEELLDHALRGFLALHPQLDRDSPELATVRQAHREGAAGDAALAAALMDEGRPAEALRLLPEGSAPLLRARTLLRLRRYDEARVALEEALEAGASGAVARLTALTLALRRGALEEAAAQVPAPAAATEPEILAARARVAWLRGDETAAMASWRELVEQHAEHRAGWWAATCLLGKAALLHGCELECALESPLLHTLPTSTRQTLRREELGRHTYGGVDELLRMQAPEGCWKDTPYEFMGAKHRPNTIVAITALAASALAAWRELDPNRVDPALQRAEAYLLDHRNLSPTAVEKCYAYAYCLRYWTGKLERASTAGEQEAAREECARLGRKLAAIQHADAGWGHEYFNPFATATALVGLALAREAGVEIEESSVSRARVALEGVRHPDGGFPYSFTSRQVPLVASAGRAPACELAILLAGGGTQPRLVSALEGFFRHQDLLRSVRVYDYHADRFGNGGFFFWHDLHGVSETLSRLGSRSRREDVSQGLLELVLEAGETGGAWMDSPNLGRSYGTAMALLTLRNIFDTP